MTNGTPVNGHPCSAAASATVYLYHCRYALLEALRRMETRWTFRIAWLPAYAPELNPVEQAWGHLKYGDLANYVPDDLTDLELAIKVSIGRTGWHPGLLRAFFHAAGLNP